MKTTALIIGRLCWQVHPEAKNENEAVKRELFFVEQMIAIKTKNEIDANDDIEFASILKTAIESLERSHSNG